MFFWDAPQNTLGSVGFGSWPGKIRRLWDELSGRNQRNEQNEWNRQQSLEAYQRDVEMWNAQNDYNSPSSQMQRYQAAGLNPNLIYSGGASAGNASGHPSYQPAQGVGRPSGIETLSRVASVISMLVGLKGSLASADAAAARAKNLATQNLYLAPFLGYRNQLSNAKTRFFSDYYDPFGGYGHGAFDFDSLSDIYKMDPSYVYRHPGLISSLSRELDLGVQWKYQDAVKNANLIHTMRINSLLQQQNSFYKLDKLIGYGTDIFSSLVSLGKFGLDAKKFKYITNY